MANLEFYLIKHHPMKTHEGAEAYLQALFTSALDGSEWSDSRLSALTPTEKSQLYPLNRRLVEPQDQPAHGVKERNPCPYRESNPWSYLGLHYNLK
jgi:hypothetical protein